MKKIFSYATALLAGLFVFTSCSDDRDSNPTLTQPTSFVLNNMEVGSGAVDLLKSTSVELTWSQPTPYTTGNAAVTATYTIELSNVASFNQKYDDAADDNTGADYIALDETTTLCKYAVPTATLATALQKIAKYPEDNVPATQEVTFRVRSAVKDAAGNEYNPIVSNTVTMTAVPYYVELKDAPIIMWYLVGNLFGGKWGSDIGATALPMFIKPGYEYDKKTGSGEIEYTNYFITGDYDNTNGNESSTAGFKIQPADFNWDLGMTGKGDGSKGTIIFRNKGDDGGHILAPEDGYYTITMNTAKNEATMVKYEGEVKKYSSVALSGSFNSWGKTEMLPYNKDGVENHAWYLVIDATPETASERGNCEIKFRTDDDWLGYGTNDGDFYASGIAGSGSNVGLPIGFKYVVSFNDITKAFSIQVLQ